MQIRLCALLLAFASALLSPPVRAEADFTLRVQAAAPAGSARIWESRNAEFEEYIRAAEIVRLEDIPLGVTRPKRAWLKPGGLVESVAWKALLPSRATGYWESYKSEIAAYEMDKLLGMAMVPVVVEKRWKGEAAVFTR